MGPMGSHGDPMGSHGAHGDPWEPMGTHGNPWERMGTHGNPWGPMGTHGTHGNPWEPMGTHGDPWEPMGPHGNPWKPMETHGSPWVPMGTPWLGSLGRAMESGLPVGLRTENGSHQEDNLGGCPVSRRLFFLSGSFVWIVVLSRPGSLGGFDKTEIRRGNGAQLYGPRVSNFCLTE